MPARSTSAGSSVISKTASLVTWVAGKSPPVSPWKVSTVPWIVTGVESTVMPFMTGAHSGFTKLRKSNRPGEMPVG